MLTFGEMQTQAGEFITRVDATYLSKIANWINQRRRNLEGRHPWFDLLRQEELTINAADASIVLPAVAALPIDVHQTATPLIIAIQRYKNFIRRNLAGKSDTGKVITLQPMGELGINQLLPTTGTITVASSSASDTTQNVRIRGRTSSDVEVSEAVLLAGTVEQVSTNSYLINTDVIVSLDATAIGTVTVRDGTVVIAEISAGRRTVRYKRYTVWPAADVAHSLFVTYKLRTYDLVNSEDTPQLDCGDALVVGAYANALREKRMFAKAQVEDNRFDQEIQVLLASEPGEQSDMEDIWMPKIVRLPIDDPMGGVGVVLRQGDA